MLPLSSSFSCSSGNCFSAFPGQAGEKEGHTHHTWEEKQLTLPGRKAPALAAGRGPATCATSPVYYHNLRPSPLPPILPCDVRTHWVCIINCDPVLYSPSGWEPIPTALPAALHTIHGFVRDSAFCPSNGDIILAFAALQQCLYARCVTCLWTLPSRIAVSGSILFLARSCCDNVHHTFPSYAALRAAADMPIPTSIPPLYQHYDLTVCAYTHDDVSGSFLHTHALRACAIVSSARANTCRLILRWVGSCRHAHHVENILLFAMTLLYYNSTCGFVPSHLRCVC